MSRRSCAILANNSRDCGDSGHCLDTRAEPPRWQPDRKNPKRTSNYDGVKSLRAALAYNPADAGTDIAQNGVIGSQFTVQPTNLATALQVWKDADADDPTLINRIEAILPGREGNSQGWVGLRISAEMTWRPRRRAAHSAIGHRVRHGASRARVNSHAVDTDIELPL